MLGFLLSLLLYYCYYCCNKGGNSKVTLISINRGKTIRMFENSHHKNQLEQSGKLLLFIILIINIIIMYKMFYIVFIKFL